MLKILPQIHFDPSRMLDCTLEMKGFWDSQHEVEHMDGLKTYFCKADTRIEFLNHLVHELDFMLILSTGPCCQRGLPEAFQKSPRSQIVWWHILGRVDLRHDERV